MLWGGGGGGMWSQNRKLGVKNPQVYGSGKSLDMTTELLTVEIVVFSTLPIDFYVSRKCLLWHRIWLPTEILARYTGFTC